MAQAVPVPLRPGEVIRLETAVVRGGIIEGEFRTVAAQNLLTRIYLVSAADTIRTVCITDLGPDDPSFQFRGVADGPYLLVGGYLDQSRWHRRWYPGSAWASAADTVWVRDHAVVSGVTWTAP